MSITITEVRMFIGALPDAAAVAEVQEAAARRLTELGEAAFADVAAGRRGRLGASLRPACMRGLTGTVQERNRTRTRVGFLLDEESTRALRTDPRNTRFRVPQDVTRYRIPRGIPLTCVELIEDASRAAPPQAARDTPGC
ncbi:hypothetical protein GCM10010245_82410 [Streptomyces spectabilis]|uniref:Uncharacterized protein n=1 Tax=Streptomyces spectabilis TaxID=68270 RepID=A0A7W8B5P6_STRST|nr:hypothetical protein [Streptomyces spectabilis]MBB5109312.1 hypothetical protein [Streptomyces spectabilis]GGV52371.1 hypothetical protein GCM10010245_82410 [Streptomyces spectabilis]